MAFIRDFVNRSTPATKVTKNPDVLPLQVRNNSATGTVKKRTDIPGQQAVGIFVKNKMLDNIYQYSKENRYDKAVFLLGSAHRNSIMQKVPQYVKKETPQLTWTFYNGKGI